MPFRICKTFEIENGHMLSKHPELCRFPHGHSRRVDIILEADDLDPNEMVCDFKLIKELIGPYLSSLDHAMCMNTADPAFEEMKERFGDRIVAFERLDPTTEVMAREIFDRCSDAIAEYTARSGPVYVLRSNVRVLSVRLWETSTSWAEYSK